MQLIQSEFVAQTVCTLKIYAFGIKDIRFWHQRYTLLASKIYASCIKGIGFLHQRYPISIINIQASYNVRSLYVQCQKLLYDEYGESLGEYLQKTLTHVNPFAHRRLNPVG